jgi:amino acid adenylation domain-containing protein
MIEPNEWVFPASYGQERIWLASQLRPDSSVYNVAMTIPLPATADMETAVSALRQVVGRHEALRTSFRADGEGLSQVVHREIDVQVAHDPDRDDLRAVAPGEAESRLHALTLAQAQMPFALDRPPLWRARIVRAGADDWRLVLVCHHSICDGASWGILDAELTEICTSAAAGQTPRLPQLGIQYADWAVWQRSEQLTPARMEQELAYWRGRLAGAPPVHALPTDGSRAAAQDYAGSEIRFEIPAEVAERVTRLARRLRVTEFAVLFGAYAALLARLGGQPDVVVGVPVAGRGQAQAASLVGMFVNTVLLRVDTSSDPSFGELAGQAAAATLEALEHAAVPLQHVVEELVSRRDPAVTPLYQVGFNHLPGVPLNSCYGTARDELALELSGLQGRVEYRTSLFGAASARAIAARYLRVLDAVTDRPDLRVSRVPLLGPGERAVLLRMGAPDGPAGASGLTGATVPELILAQAARTPDAIAVRAYGASLSYRDLVERAWSLAGRLRGQGIGPERLVALALPRSPELVVAILAVLMAGGGYQPLDPTWPAERLAFMLADSGATVLLTSAGHRPALVETSAVVLDIAGPDSPGAAGGTRILSVGPANVAYVIYTSGSTGRPKGAAIEHSSLANYVRWFIRQFGLGPADRVLASTSPSFDAFGIELFPALVAGGTVVVAPESAGPDPDALLGLAATEDVTMIATVPTVLRMLVDSPALARCTAVRQVVVGGEQLSGKLAADLAERLAVPLHNLYGPTEATIDVAAHTCLPTDRYADAVPIGGPLADARLYLLDTGGELVPVGAVGHLHAGGVPVGRGYPGRPGLTAERFVPDPFGRPGSRLYKTGDLARWTADGTLAFIGRVDSQIKIRGLRIEPAEIEAVLREQPGVRDAAVLAREEAPGDRRLVGYVLTAPEADTGAMRTALRRSLPEYMVPAAIVGVPSFPLTSHGKLDVAGLPPPDYAAAGGGRYLAPRTACERLIATVWADVLGVDRVGAGDDFFDLGGHSLLAARIAVRLSDAIGAELPIHLLFSHVTVSELARAIEELMADEIGALSEGEAYRMLHGAAL